MGYVRGSAEHGFEEQPVGLAAYGHQEESERTEFPVLQGDDRLAPGIWARASKEQCEGKALAGSRRIGGAQRPDLDELQFRGRVRSFRRAEDRADQGFEVGDVEGVHGDELVRWMRGPGCRTMK